MLIGSASRYIGGRRAVQTVYWRMTEKDEKLVKTGKNFNLSKSFSKDETTGIRSRYKDTITAFGQTKSPSNFL